MTARKENVLQIKKMIEKKIAHFKVFDDLIKFLKGKGISSQIIDSLVDEVKAEHNWIEVLNERLAKKIQTVNGFGKLKGKKCAFVGPTGVGKTTMTLKLADRYRHDAALSLLSLDHEKGGAFAQLEKYAKKWNLQLYDHPGCIEDCELLLVDTSGCNTYQGDAVLQLGKTLASIPDIEVHLVLSASAKEVDLYGAIHQFSALQPKSLIITKWDETLSPGVVVNLSAHVDIPISYLGYGYPLPGKVEVASGEEIARKILTEFNGSHHQVLRALVQ